VLVCSQPKLAEFYDSKMKYLLKTIVFILFSLSVFAQQENILPRKIPYENEWVNVKQQLQQLGYSSMPLEMQENLLPRLVGI
jgi:hypothetical protein